MSIQSDLKKGAVIGLGILVGSLGLEALISKSYAQGDRAKTEVVSSAYNTCDYESINDILEGCNITQVTPKDYKRVVEASTDKLGKLVLVYASETKVDSYSGREALVFKELEKVYGDKIDFLSYDTLSINVQRENRFIFENTPVNLIPSIIMYDKEGRLIDILRGGPRKGESHLWIDFLREEWIPTNLTNPNGEYKWVFDNSGDEHKVPYSLK